MSLIQKKYLAMEKPKNCILVIFGASGDLTKRKLIPGIFALQKQDLLPEGFGVLGVGRTEISNEDFRNQMKEDIISFSQEKDFDEIKMNEFLSRLNYLSINTKSSEDYIKVKEYLIKLNEKYNTTNNNLFYFSTPPSMYEIIADNLGKIGLNNSSDGYKRIVVEKPFGYDLGSAKHLNKQLLKYFNEDQIYRIDHYLGKETVQNVLVTRFSNGIFEPLWNRNYIHHIEISSAENLGVENRGGYYDTSGSLRDMVQNHLLQLVGLTAMEPPSSFDSNSIRNETLKVFQSLRPIKEEDVNKTVIRGQYIASQIRGENIVGYREEKGVDPNSKTETYVALKFYIDNWRWGDVPFYIRTGKRLPTHVTEIVIHFKPTPHYLFSHTGNNSGNTNNQLIIRIQPDEGILLKFGMKVPGAGYKVQTVNMDFHYSDLSHTHVQTAYERLLYDAMMGDSTLYLRGDAVEAAWEFIKPIQSAWANNPDIKIFGYPAGTWGPEHADDLIEGMGMSWRYPCKNLTDDGLYCEL
jgi:glucose-6-phosphate 1-dehydrogenase